MQKSSVPAVHFQIRVSAGGEVNVSDKDSFTNCWTLNAKLKLSLVPWPLAPFKSEKPPPSRFVGEYVGLFRPLERITNAKQTLPILILRDDSEYADVTFDPDMNSHSRSSINAIGRLTPSISSERAKKVVWPSRSPAAQGDLGTRCCRYFCRTKCPRQ
jgi:hypothetical protein